MNSGYKGTRGKQLTDNHKAPIAIMEQMGDVLEKLFGKAKILVKDGSFNNVDGTYHHYDNSQRITNNGYFNMDDNEFYNVGNVAPQVICMFPRLSSGFWIGLLTTTRF